MSVAGGAVAFALPKKPTNNSDNAVERTGIADVR
jgi:hypothetical protein